MRESSLARVSGARWVGSVEARLNSPTFATSEMQDSTIEVEFCAARVSYHLAHIATHLNLEEVDLLAGRGSSVEVAATRGRVSDEELIQEGNTVADLFYPVCS
jgi:hypothetical protein